MAACPNGAANLFTGAKVAHLNLLPQGQAERLRPGRGDGRDDGVVLRLVHEPRRVRGGLPEGDLDRRDRLMNADYLKAKFKNRKMLSRTLGLVRDRSNGTGSTVTTGA